MSKPCQVTNKVQKVSSATAKLILIVMIAASSIDGLSAQENKSSRQLLTGKWEAIGTVVNGQFKEVKEDDASYEFGESMLMIQQSGSSGKSISYESNNKKKPRQLDVRMGRENSPMIYGFDSRRLWVCHPSPGGARPRSILDCSENGYSVLVFRRDQIGAPSRYALDEVFDHFWGNGGACNLPLAKAATLKAEKIGDPVSQAWALLARCYNLAGFVNEFDEKYVDKFETLYPKVKQLADEGDLSAKFVVGFAARHGVGSEVDLALSDRYFEEAAEQGYSPAIYWLGRSLIGRDTKKAVQLLEIASAFGNAAAMGALGVIFKDAMGIAEDKERARYWMKASADRNYANGMVCLGILMQDNEEFESAFQLFKSAAELNDDNGYFQLGNCYHNGEGCSKNVEKARQNYLKACDQWSLPGEHNLGVLLYEQNEYDGAFYRFNCAAERDWLPSMVSVALCYENGIGCDRDIEKAIMWLKKASSQGYSLANENLARLGVKRE